MEKQQWLLIGTGTVPSSEPPFQLCHTHNQHHQVKDNNLSTADLDIDLKLQHHQMLS